MKRLLWVLLGLGLLGVVFYGWAVWPHPDLPIDLEELALVEKCTDGVRGELREEVLRPEKGNGPGNYFLGLEHFESRKLLPDDYKVLAKLVGAKDLPIGVYYRIHGGAEMISVLVLFEDGEAPEVGNYKLERVSPRSFEVSRPDGND
ncbi:hypothetical protein [Haloferula sp.]|uniref:hypothetical protein n=1 Tax=Haloferula sp. TaxID=2497595 RepID=UPI00329F5588